MTPSLSLTRVVQWTFERRRRLYAPMSWMFRKISRIEKLIFPPASLRRYALVERSHTDILEPHIPYSTIFAPGLRSFTVRSTMSLPAESITASKRPLPSFCRSLPSWSGQSSVKRDRSSWDRHLIKGGIPAIFVVDTTFNTEGK